MPSDGAMDWIAANWPTPPVVVESRITAARVTRGTISLSRLIALSQRERGICNYKLQLRCTVQLAPAARSSAHNFSALARLSAPTWTRAQPMLPRASP
jgi:hypothetical protein